LLEKLILLNYQVWNLIDTKGIKNLFKLALPSIKFRKKLFVKKTMPEIDIEYIKRILSNIHSEEKEISYNFEASYTTVIKNKDSNISSEKNHYEGENLVENVNSKIQKSILFIIFRLCTDKIIIF